MVRFKSLAWFLRNKELNSTDYLHLVAIENIKDENRIIERWWRKKYNRPSRDFEDHTKEELVIEMLEDYYDAHPIEIEKFLFSMNARKEVDWDGKISVEHERYMQKRFANPDLIEKYRTDKELTAAEEKKILDSLGMDLPKSKVLNAKRSGEVIPETLGADFDETF
jgi:hypothetical protein